MHTFNDIPKVRREFVLDLAVILHREISRLVSHVHDALAIAGGCKEGVPKRNVNGAVLGGNPVAGGILIRILEAARKCQIASW